MNDNYKEVRLLTIAYETGEEASRVEGRMMGIDAFRYMARTILEARLEDPLDEDGSTTEMYELGTLIDSESFQIEVFVGVTSTEIDNVLLFPDGTRFVSGKDDPSTLSREQLGYIIVASYVAMTALKSEGLE